MPTKTASVTAERMRPALRLEAITLLWMVVEASVSIGAGIAAGSLLLIAFGADSVIELISAGVLFWRLRLEAMAQPDDTEMVEAVERRASRIGGYLLYVLSAYVVLQALYGLTHRHHAEASCFRQAIKAAPPHARHVEPAIGREPKCAGAHQA